MAVWSIIDYLDTPGKRFDPEYYQPKYLELVNCLSKIDTSRIEDFAYVSDGIHNPPVREEEGIPYLTGKCVKENFISLTDTTKISEEEHNLNPRTQVQVGDILITTTGTIGDAAVVENEILPANTDRDLGIIRIDRNLHNIDPYYLSTFLNCQFGRFQTLRESTGNVQLHLFINKLKKIVIPTGDKFNEVGKLTKLAYDKRRESEALYAEAEQLLLQELGLGNLDFSLQTSYVANFDETIEAKRIDAEYFQPKYRLIVNHLLSNYETKSLEELGKVTKGKSAKYSEIGVPVIRSGDLTDLDRLNTLKYADSSQSLFYLKKYDVCISSIGFGSIGKVQLFDRDDKFVTVSEVTVIRQKEINPYYLQIFLQSLAGQLQIEKYITGATGQLHLYPRDVSKICIPIIATEKQEEFEKIILRSRHIKQEAKDLLEDAKNQVEQMILGE